MKTTPAPGAAAPTFDNSYARDLEGLFVRWQPAAAPQPKRVFFNTALAAELGLAHWDSGDGTAMLAGNRVPAGADPVAQAYAGHQFGGWSPRLGDGRALLLGEVINRHGQRRDIAFKGSGRTPFSRGGDGKAALGPMLREVLIGEAMHALGIPTTRALAVVATGEAVLREAGPLPGAVLTRVAASHLRVGTFQYAAALDDLPLLRRLLAYAVQRHDPALAQHDNPALALLEAVAERQAKLIAQWMGLGFIHGVMNTDNMTISGETIDYGPCAFMDRHDPATVFSSIDHHGRYAYGNQPAIARWNLARLAESLLPLLHEHPEQAVQAATQVIDGFPARYEAHWLAVMQPKLGLQPDAAEAAADTALAQDFLAGMQGQGVDHTLAFRQLAQVAAAGGGAATGGAGMATEADGIAAQAAMAGLHALYADATALHAWLPRWQQRLARAGSPQACAQRMRSASPWIVARNQRVEEALTAAAAHGDLAPFNQLLSLLQQPYSAPANLQSLQAYTQPAPAAQSACFQTYCGT